MKKLIVSGLLALCSTVASSYYPLAAKVTAKNSTECKAVAPFYWEIGDKVGSKVSGSVGTGYTSTTIMPIASASKMLFSAYMLQVRPLENVPYLNFTSGYTNSFVPCSATGTVLQCAEAGDNEVLYPEAVGKFSYGGAHMQQLAVKNDMGSWNSTKLASEYLRVLGIKVTFGQPQLAGGASTSSVEYAKFLRKVMDNNLALGIYLGANAVDTQGPTALSSPTTRNMKYSLGHWVETDKDGAFSSPGAVGYYPWISADKQLYGILARRAGLGAGDASAICGARIRQAYVTGK